MYFLYSSLREFGNNKYQCKSDASLWSKAVFFSTMALRQTATSYHTVWPQYFVDSRSGTMTFSSILIMCQQLQATNSISLGFYWNICLIRGLEL